MTGSKDLVVDVHKVPSMPTNVEWGDASSSKVLGLGKVVISHDLTIEKVMLVESLAYNLLSVRQLALMGFATFFDIDTMALLWSKTLKVAFVGHVENGLYVINFLERPTKTAPLDNLKNDEITLKREKRDMLIVGPGIWREN